MISPAEVSFTSSPSSSEARTHSADRAHGSESPSLLRRLLQAERLDLWAIVLYSIFIGLIYLAVPVATQAVVNTVAFGSVLQPLIVLTIIVFLALSFSAILQLLRFWVVELLQQRLFVNITSNVVSKLLQSDLRVLAAHRGPELVNRFLEVATLQKATSVLLIDGLATGSQIVFAAALLATYHPWLLGFDLLLILLISLCIFPFLGYGVRTSVAESQTKYELVAWFEEMARYPDLFRATQSSRYALKRTGTLLGNYLERRRRHFVVLLKHVVGFVTIHAFSSAALLGIGGWLVIQRQLTLGQLIASELVVNLMLNALSKFGKQLETYYDLEAAMNKLSHLTELPREQEGNGKLSLSEPGIGLTVRNLPIYDPDLNYHFEKIDLFLAPGESVALQGLAVTGKSILLDCIRGLHPVPSGSIEIDGYDLRHINLEQVRSQVALVRNVEIFDGSILENLTFGNGSVSDAIVRQTLVKVDLWSAISGFPDGVGTRLSSQGAPLTQAQTLRLMVARSLLGLPRLLILDIPLQDPAIRSLALRLLESRGGCTLLLCTDDSELQNRCDRVIDVFGIERDREVNA